MKYLKILSEIGYNSKSYFIKEGKHRIVHM